MNLHPAITIPAVLLGLFAVIGGTRFLGKRLGWHPEWQRKAVHMAMGSATLAFPWLFDSPVPVFILTALSLAALYALRTLPALRSSMGQALHGVERESLGDYAFTAAVGIVFYLSKGDPVMFCVPLLILTFADAAGALIGVRYGANTYGTLDGKKSAEGSITFFIVCFLAAHIPLLIFTEIGKSETLIIAFVLALVVMMVEAISARGLDNLIIPLATWFLLQEYRGMELEDLVSRFIIILLLLGLVLAARRWSSLDGSSLLGAVIFGYGCWAWGGPVFVLIPLGFFLSHLHATSRVREEANPQHDLLSVLGLAFTGLAWLVAARIDPAPASKFLPAFALGMAIHFTIRNFTTHRVLRPKMSFGLRLIRSAAKAIAYCYIPLFLVLDPPQVLWHAILAVALCLTACTLFAKLFPHTGGETEMSRWRWTAETILALAGSAAALILIL